MDNSIGPQHFLDPNPWDYKKEAKPLGYFVFILTSSLLMASLAQQLWTLDQFRDNLLL